MTSVKQFKRRALYKSEYVYGISPFTKCYSIEYVISVGKRMMSNVVELDGHTRKEITIEDDLEAFKFDLYSTVFCET